MPDLGLAVAWYLLFSLVAGSSLILCGGIMQISRRQIGLVALLILSTFSVGCDEAMFGQGFTQGKVQGVNDNLGSGVGPVVDSGAVDMAKLDTELDSFEADLSAVESKVNAISLLGLSQPSTGQQAVGKDIKQVFAKLLGSIKKVKDRVAELRTQIESRVGQLDPNNPVYGDALKKLNQALAYLEQLESRIDVAVSSVLGIVDRVIAKIDDAVTKLNPKSPLSWISQAAWAMLKPTLLVERDKLLLAIGV